MYAQFPALFAATRPPDGNPVPGGTPPTKAGLAFARLHMPMPPPDVGAKPAAIAAEDAGPGEMTQGHGSEPPEDGRVPPPGAEGSPRREGTGAAGNAELVAMDLANDGIDTGVVGQVDGAPIAGVLAPRAALGADTGVPTLPIGRVDRPGGIPHWRDRTRLWFRRRPRPPSAQRPRIDPPALTRTWPCHAPRTRRGARPRALHPRTGSHRRRPGTGLQRRGRRPSSGQRRRRAA